ncbi:MULTISPECIES: hypothetical protein [unclassified Actinoplanes]|uniref:hypothetical protein n=1 Tax=unclassified Actinoplanes TaxID=2626549 RepID=UPI00043A42C3|nr:MULTISPECIES: hypothetical protein [unclassified Actinoplanes]
MTLTGELVAAVAAELRDLGVVRGKHQALMVRGERGDTVLVKLERHASPPRMEEFVVDISSALPRPHVPDRGPEHHGSAGSHPLLPVAL